MNKTGEIKKLIFDQIIKNIDDRIETLKLAIESARESRDNETKCTVGDKYETGRSMMQFEMEKNRIQLNKTLNLKNELSQIDLHKKNERVTLGSLVVATNGNYFISIGIGKLEVANEIIYSISLASPIGKLLNNRKAGDKFSFQGKEITITEIF
ncbi:MAG: 3-oxoacyl-ACP synthase [Prolixibacteraceae bacterium]|jgi:transcription elongation GreA/GreB family factor|nr:3-oxoacyl-ACP synthase [Prolixibacteraceae bacterium]MBT6763856.1 3-oxoacyl-ACP synthase [Prolixibacteraceae bacterium]MBT6999724.1 3-oxoacyl-ACP synthase [Prolixibacteraceae bacterium]MBT7394680.1 3-oxoacyl-ACP synthase [Prolixibacteraceae bacterium]